MTTKIHIRIFCYFVPFRGKKFSVKDWKSQFSSNVAHCSLICFSWRRTLHSYFVYLYFLPLLTSLHYNFASKNFTVYGTAYSAELKVQISRKSSALLQFAEIDTILLLLWKENWTELQRKLNIDQQNNHNKYNYYRKTWVHFFRCAFETKWYLMNEIWVCHDTRRDLWKE